jgi:hypothetical protein
MAVPPLIGSSPSMADHAAPPSVTSTAVVSVTTAEGISAPILRVTRSRMATATMAPAAKITAGLKLLLPGLTISSTPMSPTAIAASRIRPTLSPSSSIAIRVAVIGTACITAVRLGSGMWNSAAMNSPVATRSSSARMTTSRSKAERMR